LVTYQKLYRDARSAKYKPNIAILIEGYAVCIFGVVSIIRQKVPQINTVQ